MAEIIPVFPKAGELFLRTGNIVNWDRLKRKLNQKSTEELADCISSTLTTWLDKQNRDDLQYTTNLMVLNNKFLEKINEEQREEYKLTAKVFLSRLSPEVIHEAVNTVCEELGVSSIESFLLAVPDGKHDLEFIQPLWQELEGLVQQEKIFSLGTSDLDTEQLVQLYNWANIKPCINQVNLDTCCVINPEMAAFAKEKDIQLLTHNDPKEILPEEALQKVLGESATEKDGENWTPAWTVRVSVVIKTRGVIKSKEYILKATRDIKKRNTANLL